jgi:WD40 repeat protein
MLDEHTDWVNELIYLEQSNSLLSCSNDTTIKLWKLPEEHDQPRPTADEFQLKSENPSKPQSLQSFYTFDTHMDYVRSMSFSPLNNRLFSISDDGTLVVNDIVQGKVVQEYKDNSLKYSVLQNKKYVPIYQVEDNDNLSFAKVNMASFKTN